MYWSTPRRSYSIDYRVRMNAIFFFGMRILAWRIFRNYFSEYKYVCRMYIDRSDDANNKHWFWANLTRFLASGHALHRLRVMISNRTYFFLLQMKMLERSDHFCVCGMIWTKYDALFRSISPECTNGCQWRWDKKMHEGQIVTF